LNRLYLNNGNATFTDVTHTINPTDSSCNLATTFTDFDNDNDLDLYNANDFGQWEQPNDLFLNNYPINSFSDISSSSNMDAKIYGMGIAIGDYDQDLDLDYYVTNIGRNILHKNNGNGTFIDTTAAAGVENQWIIQDSLYATGWGTAFFDVDNDSYLDLFVVNGYIQALEPVWLLDPDKLYHNNGDGTFTDISDAAGVSNTQMSRGFAYGDIDNDGDNDMLVIPIKDLYLVDTVPILLYQNNLSNNNNWLQVKLQGTTSNRDAIGAHLIIHVGGKSWLHEVMPSGSHGSQNSLMAHFGLDTASVVDSLEIIWPNGGKQTNYNITANQQILIVEGIFSNQQMLPTADFQWQVFPNPTSHSFNIAYQLTTATAVQISINNSLGQTVLQQQYPNQNRGHHQLTFDKHQHSLSSGVYTINIQTKTHRYSKIIHIL